MQNDWKLTEFWGELHFETNPNRSGHSPPMLTPVSTGADAAPARGQWEARLGSPRQEILPTPIQTQTGRKGRGRVRGREDLTENQAQRCWGP